ncbi:MAG: YicC/YloC family endoribonuclease [Gemmatimonadales bacterium]
MPNSMTGFGSAEGPVIGGRMAIDVRSVNHRHFNMQAKLPSVVHYLEQAMRERMRESVARGHVSVSARWVEEPSRGASLRVNLDQARAVLEALSTLKRELDLPGEVDLSYVARQPDVIELAPGDEQLDVEPEFMALLDDAVEQLIGMRRREGDALGNDLLVVLNRLEGHVKAVELRSPERLVSERTRLTRAVGELLDGRPINQERLELEIAILADKMDITEEVVRLRTHISASREALVASGAVGRKLAFLGQEMLRETNTVGSKANDAEIAATVIEMKGDLEKFREQVENLE